VNGGGSFGFSEGGGSGGWLVSFGLGGIGEAMVSTTRVLHFSDAESRTFVGFRVGLPVRLIRADLADHLALALNVAATGDDSYYASGTRPASDGGTVSNLGYDHRETTVGLAGTLRWPSLRLHGALHTTDLRTKNIFYSNPPGMPHATQQRAIFFTAGAGFDFALNPRTYLVGELHTTPRTAFRLSDAHILVDNLAVYATGLRFYPTSKIGMDAIVSVDEEAVGLADVELGLGLHLTLAPRSAAAPAR
jgi:hypothetical protein